MKKYMYLLVLVIISCIPLVTLMHPGLPQTHDGQDHVARIANFYQNLSEGVIIPRWAGNLNWGYGHPILMFLYPFPSYSASFFHFLGFSFVDSVKLVFALSFIASGIAMYLWTREFLGKNAAFISAMLYMFAPYRFVDLYVRGAIGEHVFFVFPPLVLFFIFRLYKKSSYWYLVGGAFSIAGLILSHNALSLMFFPFLGLYCIFLFFQLEKKTRKQFVINIILIFLLGFGVSSFFWIPAFFEGKYTLRDIVTGGREYASHFSEFSRFLYSPWNFGSSGQFSIQVGFVQWFFVIVSSFVIFKLFQKKTPLRFAALVLFIAFFGILWLMTSSSDSIWKAISTLQKFQFPWRFLSVTVFICAVLGGIVASQIPKKIQLPFVVVITITLLYFTHSYFGVYGYLQKPESFYAGIYNSTTDTGESAPIWSVRFMEEKPKSLSEVISGKAKIFPQVRNSTHRKYIIDAETRAQIRENTLYFPGWEVVVNGVVVPVEFQDPKNRGVMTYFIDKGKNNVYITFQDTRIRMLGNIVSLVSVLSLVSLVLYHTIIKRLYIRK